MTAPSARFPFEVTLHQGEIEAIFLDSLRANGREIERPIIPTEIKLNEDSEVISKLDTYPVKVNRL